MSAIAWILLPLRLPGVLWRASRNALRWLRHPTAFYVDLDESLRFDYLPRPRAGLLVRLLKRSRTCDRASLRRLLRRLARDRRVRGVIFRPEKISCSGMTPWSRIDELRSLFRELRAAGKHLIAFGHAWSLEQLALAAVAEHRVLPPPGEVSPTGLRLAKLYYREMLADLGIEAEVVRRSEYKGALEPFDHAAMPDEQREALEALLEDWYEHLVSGLAGDLDTSPGAIREHIDSGPCFAERAREQGWLTHALYEDELEGLIAEREGRERAVLPFRRARKALYLPLWSRRSRSAARTGVLRVEGLITRGKSRPISIPPFLSRTTGLESFQKEVRRARKNRRIRRWILFIDSPGGDGLASDLMWRELSLLAQDAELVACMGSVAGSGGYYIATAAHRILAHPTTLTGSIGVISGKLNASGLLRRLGIGSQELTRGRFAGLGSGLRPHDEEERALMERTVDEFYERFKNRVAQARGMSQERVEELARGRIWSGKAALANGLVDELGLLPDPEA